MFTAIEKCLIIGKNNNRITFTRYFLAKPM